MSKFALCLSGFGNVTSIERTAKGMTIKVKTLSQSSDDIELECLVTETDLINRLDELEQSCQAEEYIVLHFIVHYCKFSHCHAGLDEQDPDQMVQLKSKLKAFHGCLRSKELPPPTSPKDI